LDRVLDLTNAQVCQKLSLTNAPVCFSDKAIARATANYIRNTTTIQAIIVPSMALLDNLKEWCYKLSTKV
jgi:hypothetical protein